MNPAGRSEARTAALIALAIGVVGCLPGVWARSTYGARTSVDEPQYLLTALSLARDLDLDVSDEIDEGAYRDFHELPLDQQTAPQADGSRISPHDPLLPVILAPAMGIGGWRWARATLVLLGAAVAATTAWLAAARFGVGSFTAGWLVGLLAASQPLAPYSSQVYPEIAAALAVVAVTGALLARRQSRVALTLASLGVVALPWLGIKYLPVAAVLGLWLLWRSCRERGRGASLVLGVLLASAGLVYLVVHRRVYGGWTVYSAGDHFAVAGEFSVVGTDPDYLGRSRRLIGLLVDSRFGLVPWQPLWVLAPVAVVWLARVDRRMRWGAAVVAAGYLTATYIALTMHGWWSPGRQVVVVLPLAALALVVLVDRHPRLRPVAVALAVLGACNWLWLVWESNTGRRTLVVDFHETAALPYRMLSAVFPDPLGGGGELLLAAWAVPVALAAVVAGVGWRPWSRRRGDGCPMPEVLSVQADVEACGGLPVEQ